MNTPGACEGVCLCVHVCACVLGTGAHPPHVSAQLGRWVTDDAGHGSGSLHIESPLRLFPSSSHPVCGSLRPFHVQAQPPPRHWLWLWVLASLVQPKDSSSFSPPLPWSQCLSSPNLPWGSSLFSALRVNLGFLGGVWGIHWQRKRQPSFGLMVCGFHGHI